MREKEHLQTGGKGLPSKRKIRVYEMPGAIHQRSCLLVEIRKNLIENLTICNVGK